MRDDKRASGGASASPEPSSEPSAEVAADVTSDVASEAVDAGEASAPNGVVDAKVVSLTAEPDELAMARAEAAANLDDARRLKAEFENYRKRVQREQETLTQRASAGLIDKLLPVLDSFRLALIAADRTKDYEALVRGVELVYGELRDVMHKEGLEEIEAGDKLFDPEVHEAVIEAEGGEPGGEPHVVDVLRTGYRFKGRVLRPAMVKVERR
ncbi:MAG: nucleotide exchange factor GrpE [Actinomycetota bacterium]